MSSVFGTRVRQSARVESSIMNNSAMNSILFFLTESEADNDGGVVLAYGSMLGSGLRGKVDRRCGLFKLASNDGCYSSRSGKEEAL